jgi:hypothetical protein
MQRHIAPDDSAPAGAAPGDTPRGDHPGPDDTALTDRRVRAFADALQAFERDGRTEDLLARFRDGATAERLDGRGARTDLGAFWQEYLSPFDHVATTFRHAVQTGDSVALEWHSDAVLAGGGPVTVRGVTVLDLTDATDDDGSGTVTALRTYYDTAVFVTPPHARV